jgi:hypothetical protein
MFVKFLQVVACSERSMPGLVVHLEILEVDEID